MNYTPVTGWFYINANNRTASWTGVPFFYRFLTENRSVGPFGEETGLAAVEPGDFIQLTGDGTHYTHTLVVVRTGKPPTAQNVLVATHTYDAFGRPVDSYSFAQMRCIHILGYRQA